MSIKISAPATVMILGEHAVLHGTPAVVAAIDQRLSITLTPRTDRNITIFSDAFGKHETTLNNIKIENPFQFILAAIQYFQPTLKTGFDLHISSQFSHQVGLGSSAAITVATIAALQKLTTNNIDKKSVCQLGTKIIREIQGVGSGADIAASTLGGILAYQTKPFIAEPLTNFPKINLIYSGYKTKTIDVIKQVGQHYQSQPELFDQIFEAINLCTKQGIIAIQKEDWETLGKLFNIHQGCLDALQVNDKTLSDIIYTCRQFPNILGAKISGSGLGDCIITLGELPKNYPLNPKQQLIDLTIDSKGVCDET